MPLRRPWAKLAMTLQSSVALVTVGLVIARAVKRPQVLTGECGK